MKTRIWIILMCSLIFTGCSSAPSSNHSYVTPAPSEVLSAPARTFDREKVTQSLRHALKAANEGDFRTYLNEVEALQAQDLPIPNQWEMRLRTAQALGYLEMGNASEFRYVMTQLTDRIGHRQRVPRETEWVLLIYQAMEPTVRLPNIRYRYPHMRSVLATSPFGSSAN